MGTIYIKHTAEDELYHYGILGMHWGVRRYQNPDGSLTSAGKARLSKYKKKELADIDKRYDKDLSRYHKSIVKNKEKIRSDPYNTKYKKRLSRSELMLKATKGFKYTEQKAVRTMSYNDMQKEKKAAGMAYVKTVLTTAAGSTLLPMAMFAAGSPIGVRVGYIYSPTAAKQKLRADRIEGKQNVRRKHTAIRKTRSRRNNS